VTCKRVTIQSLDDVESFKTLVRYSHNDSENGTLLVKADGRTFCTHALAIYSSERESFLGETAFASARSAISIQTWGTGVGAAIIAGNDVNLNGKISSVGNRLITTLHCVVLVPASV